MEDKNILIDTLKILSRDLQREKFILRAVRKKRDELLTQENKTSQKIKEIRGRITYNINTHGKLLKNNE